MKFYEVEVYAKIEEQKTKSLGKIVIKKDLLEYKEALSDISIEPLSSDNKKEKEIANALNKYGFFLYFNESDLVNKNYAKLERVEEYINNFNNLEFKNFIDDNEYVFGTDHKDVKKLIRKAKRTI